ncbi:Hypothetical protein NCS54_00265300 [Fusarium falciforme]|uniref:Hypothetical protein n=1 Tax=Fusarium falciforme TaxID=195108 RepID=UPI0022FFCA3A|nr:Hypothetical protein NCS54_00265300 [Fusarium falciforme]WAO85413.1 Hypothetical protein NCS54_00265300 [Fusarium falciforme]
MPSPPDCLCSIISTALDTPRIDIDQVGGQHDHVCLTAMDFPSDWEAAIEAEMAQLLEDEADELPLPLAPITSTTTTTTAAATTATTANSQNDDTNALLSIDNLGSPKPAPLSKWNSIHFNKPTTTVDKMLPPLMKKSEIEETRNFELYRLHSIAFELNKGDTLVFIDYPIHQKEALSYTDCNGITFKPLQFRINSGNLVGKFAEMLAPTYQFRVLRRLKLVNKLADGVKYVLDLTPPSEGDELVFQMTELSLTPGIIKWWSTYLTNEVDPWLVCGHDDICGCKRQKEEETKEDEPKGEGSSTEARQNATASPKEKKELPKLPLGPDAALAMKARGEDEVYKTPSYRKVPDYCPIRHRNGILRLLLLLEGKGVILDSAIRVWTLVKLGTIFDCAHVLRDRVAQWIMHGPNTALIEHLPEEALQIAFALELPEVGQSAFRILVNEAALKLASTSKETTTQFTIFGRRLGDLPDDLQNLVQHGAMALVERVSNIDAQLRNPDLFDFWDIEEWNKMREIEQCLANGKGLVNEKALYAVQVLKQALLYEVQSAYESATSKSLGYNHPALNSIDHDRLLSVEPRHFEKTSVIMSSFNPVQLLLCSITYNELGTLLDDRRYRDCKCQLPGYLQTTYRTLTSKAFQSLRDVLICAPAQVQTSGLEWYIRKWLGEDPTVWLDCIERGVKDALRSTTLSWLRHEIEPPLNLTRHLLLTLTNNEIKYLPLWAGGCDDGSGGVFQDLLPPTSWGANGPGPGYHTGRTIPSAPSSVTEFITEDMNALRMWGSTTGASIDVHDSISTVYHPDRVISEDQSIASESFTEGRSDDYQDARFEIPADHQSIGQAVDLTVEAADSETRSMTEGRQSSDDDDDDMYLWGSDSDDSGDTVMV